MQTVVRTGLRARVDEVDLAAGFPAALAAGFLAAATLAFVVPVTV